MLQVTKIAVAAALLLATISAPVHGATAINGTLTGDAYITPNNSSGTAKVIPLFAFYKDENSTFFFNRHYSTMIMKWSLAIPAELVGKSYFITSAKVVLWQAANQQNWDPAAGKIKLYATGISGDNSFTTQTWTEAQGYVGPSAVSATPAQDPFMVELGTNNRAEDNLSAIPWAFGEFDPSYDGSAVPTEAFPITFNLDVSNPVVREKLRNDLQTGISMWTAGATFEAAQPGGVPTKYPRLVTKEGATDPAYGTLQQAPAIVIEVSTTSAARNWELY